MNNKGLNLMMKFAILLIVILIFEIVFLIKIFNLTPSIYIPVISIINLSIVSLYWWKAKRIRKKDHNE